MQSPSEFNMYCDYFLEICTDDISILFYLKYLYLLYRLKSYA